MARPLRIHLPDLVYHVLNRGNNRQDIFLEEKDYLHYLDILKRYKEKFNFKLFAYCLMANHIHLLIRTSNQGTISDIMKAITIAHTRHYHFIYKTSGHVWQGRFKSPIVSDDEYLLTLMRYIEQNPVRAGIVDHPGRYSYSSFHYNTNPKKNNFIDKEENPVFLSLAETMQQRIKRYSDFVLELLDENKIEDIKISLGGQSNFASEQYSAYVKEILEMPKRRQKGRPRTRDIHNENN